MDQSKKDDKQSYSVLHLDDDKDYLKVSKVILERSTNIKLYSTDSPLKAIEMMFDGFYDVIITDLQMPGMSGFEFIESIRIVDQEIPIIVLSSNLDPAKIVPYKNIFEFSKQVDPSILFEQITNLIYQFGSKTTSHPKISNMAAFKRIHKNMALNSLMDRVNVHDIKNQLNIQETLLCLLIEQNREIPELTDCLTKILHTTDQIHTIIKSADRMQNLESDPQWLNIVDLFHLASKRADQEGIVSSIDDHEIEILADPFFDRIFLILVENSIMHGEKVTAISLTANLSDTELVLIYKDNGKGVPLGEKENIFVKGYGNNTGQGLFFVQSLLNLMNFSIQETGKPGIGVKFEIRIPASQCRNIAEKL